MQVGTNPASGFGLFFSQVSRLKPFSRQKVFGWVGETMKGIEYGRKNGLE